MKHNGMHVVVPFGQRCMDAFSIVEEDTHKFLVLLLFPVTFPILFPLCFPVLFPLICPLLFPILIIPLIPFLFVFFVSVLLPCLCILPVVLTIALLVGSVIYHA
jgi:hypothetical protein